MKLLTVQEVSNILNVHERTIRRYINNGLINANRVGNQWRIDENSLNEFLNKKCCSNDSVHIDSNDFCIFMDSDYFTSEDEIQVCIISDFSLRYENEYTTIINYFKALAYDIINAGRKMKVEHARDSNKLRVVVWINVSDVVVMAQAIKKVGEQLEA